MDFSIVIPHRGNALGLWATVHSVDEALKRTNYTYEYAILSNGEPKAAVEVTNLVHFLKSTGRVAYYQHMEEAIAPPIARHICAEMTSGRYIAFFDNHCLVAHNYFDRAAWSFERYGMGVLHSTYIYYIGEHTHYHYKLRLERDFWAKANFTPQDAKNPYRCGASGHGGFLVTRDLWNDVGGYWDGFKGYGGEETYFDLKCWLMGHEVYQDPKLIHYHSAGSRGYHRHYTDDFYINMMSAANIIGGEPWLYKVYENFSENFPKHNTGVGIYDLLMTAQSRSHERAAWVKERRIRTLDEQLEWFKENGVAY